MRKAAVLLVTLATMMIVVGGIISQSLLILQRVAAVEAVEGMVWVRQRGRQEFLPLSDRARVAAGDTIKTGANARLDLHWLDATRMRIGPNSNVTVLKTQYHAAKHTDTATFKLDLGRVWIRVIKALSSRSKFEVITPTATAGVRGTIFSVEVTPAGKTLVSVKEGKVAVDVGGTAQAVAQGEMLSAGSPQALAAGEADLWQANEAIAGPYLEVREPMAGTAVAPQQPVHVSGTSEPGAAVKISGQPLALRLQKLFETDLTAPATAGPWSITIEAKDRRGYVTRREVRLDVK